MVAHELKSVDLNSHSSVNLEKYDNVVGQQGMYFIIHITPRTS